MIFQTPRLRIRRLQWNDLEAFHELQSNEKVMRYTTGRPFSREENEADLKNVLAKYEVPGNTFWVWAMERKLDHHFVGTCAIVETETKEFEIGYRVLERFWGNGYGLEVTNGLIIHGFNEMDLPELVAYVDKKNQPSVIILEKSPFSFVKELYNENYQSEDYLYKINKAQFNESTCK